MALRKPRDRDRRDGLCGYDKDGGFIAGDDEKLTRYDNAYKNEISDSDSSDAEKQEQIAVEIARDAYQVQEKLEKIRTNFSINAAIQQLQVPIVDLKQSIQNIFIGEGSIDNFINKFDASLLGGTFTAFRSTINRNTVAACLPHGIWKIEPLHTRVADTCVLCNLGRESCQSHLVTNEGFLVGNVGDDCATRWSLLDQIYSLRSEILSMYGCGNENDIAAHYYTRILELQENCILTLQELQNRFKPKQEDKNVD